MEYVYAALVLHKAGKEVTESSLKSVLEAAGVKADDGRIKALIAALTDVNIDEAIANAAPVAAPAAAGAAPAGDAPAGDAPKKEKKEEGKKPEEAAAGLGSLFG
ncbi:50S ribosomal protein P1 [Candidatus Woesearchaeota archaeon]|nr:50S ribosomal protein P1 [Candidatus Woesearchaeota archaeon]